MTDLSRDFVVELFGLLGTDSDAFFSHVADHVHWTVMGTHPLAGVYHSKSDFLTHTFARLKKILHGGIILKVHHIFVSGDHAVVEMENISTALNGEVFQNTYCWIVRFEGPTIVEVRAYVDSALVASTLADNEGLIPA